MKRIEAVNDFVIKFANVNGSGSASANELFAKSFLRMGIPVSPRNIFPSNIQGLPTWYEVRVTEAGWLGRRGGVDMMVAMNPQTWDKDVREIDPGGYLFYDNTKPLPPSKFRDDIHVVGMPLTEICNATYTDARERQLFKNIIYVGALAALLGIEPGVIAELIGEQYKGKEKLLKPNLNAFQMGYDYAEEKLKDAVGLKAQRAYQVGERIFIDGNAAAAWAWSTAAPRSAPGIRSRRRPRWRRRSSATARDCASTRRPGRTASPSSRPRTSWPRSAWSSAPAGTARAPSPPRRGRASR